MELAKALEVLKPLADGVDPSTMEPLAADHPLQRAETVRALIEGVRVLESVHERRLRRSDQPANSGKPWTPQEDQLLSESFARGVALPAIAAEHLRTEAAICARLLKLGKVSWNSTEPSKGLPAKAVRSKREKRQSAITKAEATMVRASQTRGGQSVALDDQATAVP